MVHQMMNTKMPNAASASNTKIHMTTTAQKLHRLLSLSLLMLLASCASPPEQEPVATHPPVEASAWPELLAWDAEQALPATVQRSVAQWQAVHWADVPGVDQDTVEALLPAWLRSCERAPKALAPWCARVRTLTLEGPQASLRWLVSEWQPYRVQSSNGDSEGLLTGYFEPMLHAARERDATHTVPLHATPKGWRPGQTWYTRQQADQDPVAMAALAGRELVWVSDPVDALIVQIQGSGRVLVREPDGQERTVRLAFAGHNGQTYQSVARWLMNQGQIRSATWPVIKAWAAQNPNRVQAMLWSNPRLVFFREEPLSGLDSQAGPRGAQGVPLTPQRSIAVDRRSIPYGTPVWLSTQGPVLNTQRWVMAQDTGGAILGAVRADYFTGWGEGAKDMASTLKQPLALWALWPRGLVPPQ
jgi:membrane-bound lytic murein transglycosylase A